MVTDHPHLDEQQEIKRQRRRRTWIGFAVMVALVIAAIIALALNAGRWGVPLFPFTNDHGSQCKNDWLGYTCSEITIEEVENRLAVELPAGATLASGTFRQTHDYELNARVVYPQAEAREGWDRLNEKFGDCRQDLPSPLSTEPGISGLCVMTNQGVAAIGTEPSAQIWRISTATQADGDTLVDVHLRSR